VNADKKEAEDMIPKAAVKDAETQSSCMWDQEIHMRNSDMHGLTGEVGVVCSRDSAWTGIVKKAPRIKKIQPPAGPSPKLNFEFW